MTIYILTYSYVFNTNGEKTMFYVDGHAKETKIRFMLRYQK